MKESSSGYGFEKCCCPVPSSCFPLLFQPAIEAAAVPKQSASSKAASSGRLQRRFFQRRGASWSQPSRLSDTRAHSALLHQLCEEMSGDADVQHQRELKFPEQSTPHARLLSSVRSSWSWGCAEPCIEALSLAEISGLAKPRAVPPAFVPPHPWKTRIAATSLPRVRRSRCVFRLRPAQHGGYTKEQLKALTHGLLLGLLPWLSQL